MIIRDLISICVFTISLYVLYSIINPNIALLCSILVIIIYTVQNFKLRKKMQKEIKMQNEYYAGTLIHDLKVPTLAQLRGLELLVNSDNFTNEQNELLTQIQDSCKYTLDMISMILKTYQIENGCLYQFPEKFDIAELTEDCFHEVDTLAKEKNITFELYRNKETIELEIDKNNIKTVLLNLLKNALMYSVSNERISVRIKMLSGFCRMEITCRGIFISETERKEMFEKAEKNSEKLVTVGHNIGLYLCKKIAEINRGKIYMSSDRHKENTFVLIIPKCSYKSGALKTEDIM